MSTSIIWRVSLCSVWVGFLCACRTYPVAISPPTPILPEAKDQLIYVHNHGKHTGISLQASKVNEQIPELKKRFPDVRYYEIGWGDAGFYQAEKITSRLTLHAIFRPTPTILHIVGYDHEPLMYFTDSKNQEVYITSLELQNMIRFISTSFARDDAGYIIHMRAGIYGDSQFYEGVGKYFLFNTCNKWTAKALYSGGVDIGIPLKITSGSVMRGLGTVVRVKTASKYSAYRTISEL